MGHLSFWRFSFYFAFLWLFSFNPKFEAQAEITFTRINERFYLLNMNGATTESSQVKVHSSAEVLRASESGADAAWTRDTGQQGGEISQSENEAPIKTPATTYDDNKEPTTESNPSDRGKKSKRSATYGDKNLDRSTSGDARSREGFVEPFQGGSSSSSSRAEYRRSGEEVRGSNPRQSEPHLDTSTFALSGDSAHNQAMVHWSGHNSSVILILTKLYDFNLGAVTESSLWRSTDYGSTYSKLNDKVGSRTVLSYLYVCPTNKQKIMMLSDPEVESAVLISSDEGASFEKHPINFNILSLLFHPAQENWILAYSHDGKVYSSMDFGKRWILVHDNVMPGRFYWAVMGLDRESDVVHIETRIAKGHAQYVKCRAQRCTEGNRQFLFPGYVDTNSLVVQDEYVFTQARSVFEFQHRHTSCLKMCLLAKTTLQREL